MSYFYLDNHNYQEAELRIIRQFVERLEKQLYEEILDMQEALVTHIVELEPESNKELIIQATRIDTLRQLRDDLHGQVKYL